MNHHFPECFLSETTCDFRLRLMLDHWHIGENWDTQAESRVSPDGDQQYLGASVWHWLDTTVLNREHWTPISLDLTFGEDYHRVGKLKDIHVVDLYDLVRTLTCVTALKIRKLPHLDLWTNLPPHWTNLSHLSLEFNHDCFEGFQQSLNQMTKLKVLVLGFKVHPKLEKLDLSNHGQLTGLSFKHHAKSRGLPPQRLVLGVMPDLEVLILKGVNSSVNRESKLLELFPHLTRLERLKWEAMSNEDYNKIGTYLPANITDLHLSPTNYMYPCRNHSCLAVRTSRRRHKCDTDFQQGTFSELISYHLSVYKHPQYCPLQTLRHFQSLKSLGLRNKLR